MMMDCGGMMGWGGGMMGWGMTLWGVLLILLLLAILAFAVLGCVWLVRRIRTDTGQSRSASHSAESVQDVLRRRYAAGEIDEAEYERRLSTLNPR